ncbi:MAG: hypothetical protein AB1512_12930, partial [Thermodesulfobacteriota bacterium]
MGKTTIGLLLAKFLAGQMKKRVCVVDLDFVGSGMATLLSFEGHPESRIEEYYTDMDPEKFYVQRLMGIYKDPDMQGEKLSCILNWGENWEEGKAEEVNALRRSTMGLIVNDPHYREIQTKTALLIKRLSGLGFDFTVVDCHPGLLLVSETLGEMADLSVYVTTPNRSDCLSLFKAVGQRSLDRPGVFLVMNMADSKVTDTLSLKALLTRDPIVGFEADYVYPHLQYFGVDESRYASIPASPLLQRAFYLGSKGNTVQLMITKHFLKSIGAEGLEPRGRNEKLLIFRFTPRGHLR